MVNATTPIEIDFLPVSHCYPRKRTEPWRSMLTDAQGSPRTIMEMRESPTNPKLISTSSPKKSARCFKSWRKPHERSFHPVHRLYRLFMPASAVSETKYKPLQHQRAFQYLLWGLILQCAFHASQNRNESRRGEVPAAKKRKRTSKRCNCPFATKYPPRATNIPEISHFLVT